jgi:hypothetical protein
MVATPIISFRQADLLMTNKEVADQQAAELAEYKKNHLMDMPLDDIESNPNIANVIKEVLAANESEFRNSYDFYDNGGEDGVLELQWKSIPGFFANINGGFGLSGSTSVEQIFSSGIYPNNKKIRKRLDDIMRENNDRLVAWARDNFKDELAKVPDNKINYPDLCDLGLYNVAKSLLEYQHRSGEMPDYHGYFKVKVYYYNPNNRNKKLSTKKPEIYVFSEDMFREIQYKKSFLFSTLTELRTLLDRYVKAAIKAIK